MRECGFADAVDFMRTLRANKFQIRRGRDVPADVANEYWSRLPGSNIAATGRQLIGIVCAGGFLTDTDGGPFVLPFNAGITILLGDRGSGKSTILNLLGVLGSPTDNSGVLLTKLMHILREDPDRELNRARRVRYTLRHYGVAQYACFHSHEGQIFCYIANTDTDQFAFLRRRNDRFEFAKQSINTLEMQILQQGEVFRIADTSNQFYLNSLFDALFPALESKRQDLVRAVKAHTAIVKYLRGHRPPRNYRFERFIQKRRRELRTLNAAIARGFLDSEARRILEVYQEQIQRLDGSVLPATIWGCFSPPENEHFQFWYLLVARAADYLAGELPTVLKWQTRDDEDADERFRAFLADEWDDDEDDDTDQVADPSDDDHIIELPVDIENVSRQPREILSNITRGLRQRLKRLARWNRLFHGRWQWNDQLRPLANSYSTILQTHIELVESQEQVCQQVTNLFNRDGTIVRVFTNDTQALITSARDELAFLAAIPAAEHILLATAPVERPDVVNSSLNRYINATSKLLARCNALAFDDEAQEQLFYSPIEIELRQGSEFRSFVQLSFGQKSGIILKMVLSATSKRLIIIDQPEDNLDTNAVVHMLGPALHTLGRDRQVIIATHSSNLIMGLADANLVVVESSGAHGHLVTQGSLLTPALTRAVLDILEGGATAFETKLKAYEQFVQQLTGQIRDMDISAIESTFRRRAIDGLRNFLQPVISDRAMLEFFRHELRQPSRLGVHIKEAKHILQRNMTADASRELIGKVERVLDTLDGHVAKLQATIEEMRMLDTQPRKSQVRLGPLLHRLADEYRKRFGQRYRRIAIVVDSELLSPEIHADADHLRLVFANLFKNSLRATELQAISELRRDGPQFEEQIEVNLVGADPFRILLSVRDNGRGIPADIAPKLYWERCSDQVGEGHGLGGIIIRKILDLNGGTIRVVSSTPGVGTLQELTLLRPT